jgi:Tfp pilus assembly protein PilF
MVMADDPAVRQNRLNLLTALPSSESVTSDMLATVYEYTALAHLGLGNEAAAMVAIDTALAGGETGNRHFIRARILDAQGEDVAAMQEYEWVLAWSQVYPFAFRGDAEAALETLRGTTS